MFCFKGKIELEGKAPYVASVPTLELMTQGMNLDDAFSMVEELLSLIEDDPLNFSVKWLRRDQGEFAIFSDDKRFIALMLKRKRQASGLTLKDVAKKLGYKSHNAIWAYEEGKREPTLSKLKEIISVYGVDLELGGYDETKDVA